jgi:hypothetical protein
MAMASFGAQIHILNLIAAAWFAQKAFKRLFKEAACFWTCSWAKNQLSEASAGETAARTAVTAIFLIMMVSIQRLKLWRFS